MAVSIAPASASEVKEWVMIAVMGIHFLRPLGSMKRRRDLPQAMLTQRAVSIFYGAKPGQFATPASTVAMVASGGTDRAVAPLTYPSILPVGRASS